MSEFQGLLHAGVVPIHTIVTELGEGARRGEITNYNRFEYLVRIAREKVTTNQIRQIRQICKKVDSNKSLIPSIRLEYLKILVWCDGQEQRLQELEQGSG
ncbi:MAG: hypothetical protein WC107_01655 [Patescibacteria group bacterium]